MTDGPRYTKQEAIGPNTDAALRKLPAYRYLRDARLNCDEALERSRQNTGSLEVPAAEPRA